MKELIIVWIVTIISLALSLVIHSWAGIGLQILTVECALAWQRESYRHLAADRIFSLLAKQHEEDIN